RDRCARCQHGLHGGRTDRHDHIDLALGLDPCWALAVYGPTVIAPPRRVMKSRRFITLTHQAEPITARNCRQRNVRRLRSNAEFLSDQWQQWVKTRSHLSQSACQLSQASDIGRLSDRALCHPLERRVVTPWVTRHEPSWEPCGTTRD